MVSVLLMNEGPSEFCERFSDPKECFSKLNLKNMSGGCWRSLLDENAYCIYDQGLRRSLMRTVKLGTNFNTTPAYPVAFHVSSTPGLYVKH